MAVATDDELQRVRRRRHGAPPPTSDDVVAALSFGFWSSILASPKSGLEQQKLWHRCLHSAFPYWTYLQGAKLREAFVRWVELLRKFRNRVAHHEPIHNRLLADDHDRLVEMAGYIHADLATFIEGHSRVPAVLACRRAAVDDGQCQFEPWRTSRIRDP